MFEDMTNIRTIARKFAIKNALDYGKADVGIVLNKLFEDPDVRGFDINKLKEIVNNVVKEVNSLPLETVVNESKNYIFSEKKQRLGLSDLNWVTPNVSVNTRFAPNPSGFLHIGHAKIAILCDEYAKKYNGKFIVRFEDTDPKTKVPLLEAYDSIINDLKWLGCNISGVFKQSERLGLYYEYARKLIEAGLAYVCVCDYITMQKNRDEGIACNCRNFNVPINLSNWEKMFTTFNEKDAVLRLKTDLNHQNISVRDWVMFRIIKNEHTLQKDKYKVWPLYNFAAVIDDHDMEITLVIRGKEHEINMMKQIYLYNALGWAHPHSIEVGILKINGEFAHKSDINKAIKEGRLTGWDDPRAPTVNGFRNKGITPEAIREYIINSGIGKNDSFLDFKKLDAINRKVIRSYSKVK